MSIAQPRDIAPKPAATPSGAGFYADSWAVIIGINDYQHPRVPKLRYAVNDAQAVERALLAQGFRQDRIVTLIDREATKARIETVLGDDLRQKVGPNDRVLVFFAGHGKTDRLRSGEEEGYLIPVDGDPGRLFGTGISMTALRQISDRLPAKHILYIVDACYSGYALFNRAISDDLLEEMVKKPAIQILTAGRQQDQAQERGGYGVFTEVLVRGLQGAAFSPQKGWLALEELGVWVKQRVFAESNKKQLPQYGNLSGEGQFIFVKPGVQIAAVQPPEPPRPTIREEVRQELGSLAISAKLSGVEVWLGEQKLGETKLGRALVVENLPVGTYRLTARKAGHKEWEREVQVVADQRAEVVIDIEPLRSEPEKVIGALTQLHWRAPVEAKKLRNPVTSLGNAKRIAETNCVACHGPSGKGDGPAAPALPTKPGDWTSERVQGESDGELFWKITNGQGAMPPWKFLPEKDRWELVNYMRTFKK